MSWINMKILSLIGILPKWMVHPFAKTYVAGETVEKTIQVVKKLNGLGYTCTLDILGEHIKSSIKAETITNDYCNLYKVINEENLNCNISIKLTHIGLELDQKLVENNLEEILQHARLHNNFLRIDMESSKVTNHTIKVYKECKSVYDKVGLVLQAYLKRSVDDLKLLSKQSLNSRICKGIYNESSQKSFNSRISINENYIKMAKLMNQYGSYAAYATHDQNLIDQLISWIKANKISESSFEFQVLYGVPMQGRLEQLINQGHKVRIYVPYGKDWFDYSVRRLKENPNIIKYVLKNFLKSN